MKAKHMHYRTITLMNMRTNLKLHQVLNPHVSYRPLELLGQMTGTAF